MSHSGATAPHSLAILEVYEALRNKYTSRFVSEFQNILHNDPMVNNMKNVSFHITGLADRTELITFLSTMFSAAYNSGKEDMFAVFDLSETELKPLVISTVDSNLAIGRSIIVRHKPTTPIINANTSTSTSTNSDHIHIHINNHIVAFFSANDIFDDYFMQATKNGSSLKLAHCAELFRHSLNDFFYKDRRFEAKVTLINVENLNMYYGCFGHPGWASIHHTLRETGFSKVLFFWVHRMYSALQYTHFVGVSTNTRTRMNTKRRQKSKKPDERNTRVTYKSYNMSSFVFADATTLDYYWARYQRKYNLSPTELLQMQHNCKFAPVLVELRNSKL